MPAPAARRGGSMSYVTSSGRSRFGAYASVTRHSRAPERTACSAAWRAGAGGRAVDVAQVLPRQGAPANRHARPVVVHHELPASLAVVALAAAVQERAVRVDQHLDVLEARRPARIAGAQAGIGIPKLGGDEAAEVQELRPGALLEGDQHVLHTPGIRVLANPHQELAVRALAAKAPGAAAVPQRGNERMRQEVLRRQPADPAVVPGPAHRDALVVHVLGPRARVLPALAHRIVHDIAVRHDGVRLDVADVAADGPDDVGERAVEARPRHDGAGEEHALAPDATSRPGSRREGRRGSTPRRWRRPQGRRTCRGGREDDFG